MVRIVDGAGERVNSATRGQPLSLSDIPSGLVARRAGLSREHLAVVQVCVVEIDGPDHRAGLPRRVLAVTEGPSSTKRHDEGNLQ